MGEICSQELDNLNSWEAAAMQGFKIYNQMNKPGCIGTIVLQVPDAERIITITLEENQVYSIITEPQENNTTLLVFQSNGVSFSLVEYGGNLTELLGDLKEIMTGLTSTPQQVRRNSLSGRDLDRRRNLKRAIALANNAYYAIEAYSLLWKEHHDWPIDFPYLKGKIQFSNLDNTYRISYIVDGNIEAFFAFTAFDNITDMKGIRLGEIYGNTAAIEIAVHYLFDQIYNGVLKPSLN